MSAAPLHLLILDDDPHLAPSIAAWFRSRRWSVAVAPDAASADRAYTACAPDLLLVDIHLPGDRPLAWAETALARPGCAPLFVMTGKPDFPTACRAANIAVAGYLLKPLDLPALEPRLRTAALAHRQNPLPASLVRRLIAELDRRADPTFTPEQDSTDWCSTEAAARQAPPSEIWRSAVLDAIATLRQTKRAFQSTELARLRHRLQQLVDSSRIDPANRN